MSHPANTDAYNLAIETSGRFGSVAVGRGCDILESADFPTTINHGVELLPTVDALCRRHGIPPQQIGQVYFSGGPGSFTGLRIGVTVARTLAWANNARVVRVPTLDVIAQNAIDLAAPPQEVAVTLDAKRGNIYAATFVRRSDRFERIDEPAERNPAEFFQSLSVGCSVTGEGLERCGEAATAAGLTALPADTFRPRAAVVYRLGVARALAGDFDDPEGLIPIYIRRPEAEEVWERKHGGRPS